MFIKVTPDKKEVYVGEQVVLHGKFYTRYSLAYISNHKPHDAKNHSYSVSVIRLKDRTFVKPTKDTMNNKIFMSMPFTMHTLYPNHTGNIKLDADTATCFVSILQKKTANGIEQFFGGSYKNVSYSITTDQPTIQVNPLPPTDKPFSGLVGRFKVNVSMDDENIKPGDSVHLKVILVGDGNLKLLNTIAYKFPDGLKQLPPTLSDSTYETDDDLVFSNRTFNYVFIAKTEGSFEVPAASITYFDPYKKNYAELAIPGFSIVAINPSKN
jgi:BatD DUF11 like domain